MLLRVVGTCWLLPEQFVNTRTMRLNVISALLLASNCLAAGADSLWPIQQQLTGRKFVDLTHEFAPGIPHWPGFPDETRKTIYWYEKRPDTMGMGFFSEVFTHVG